MGINALRDKVKKGAITLASYENRIRKGVVF
jgi:hypothetical protein